MVATRHEALSSNGFYKKAANDLRIVLFIICIVGNDESFDSYVELSDINY